MSQDRHRSSLLGLAVAGFPDLIQEKSCAGINGKIAKVKRLVAFQIDNEHFSIVIVKCESKCRLAIRRIDRNGMSALAVKPAAECIAGKSIGRLIQRHLSFRVVQQAIAAPVERRGSAGVQVKGHGRDNLRRRGSPYFIRQFHVRSRCHGCRGRRSCSSLGNFRRKIPEYRWPRLGPEETSRTTSRIRRVSAPGIKATCSGIPVACQLRNTSAETVFANCRWLNRNTVAFCANSQSATRTFRLYEPPSRTDPNPAGEISSIY